MMPEPRSVGRDHQGFALIVAAVGLIAILGILARPGNASPRTESPVDHQPARIGMNSCAARGCHGAVDSTDPAHGEVFIKNGAYTTWLNYDPHARAYDVLLEKRSITMAERLRGPLEGRPAHQARLCLSCHATVGPTEPKGPGVAPLSDGISCEACHGPADRWQDLHLSPSWRAQEPSKKAADGWVDLSTPTARARSCVGCHVGDRARGMDVNHDLIAAGHPRLNFEFAAYQASYPKHWREKDRSADFEARSWAIGQVVTAQTVLDLVAARAEASREEAARKSPSPEAVWPEFSEYECFACHHDLSPTGSKRTSGLIPGRLAWQTWPAASLPDLIQGRSGLPFTAWPRLGGLMVEGEPDPRAVGKLAAEARTELDEWLKTFEAKPIDPNWLEARWLDLTSRKPTEGEGWDRLAQRFLVVQAIARTRKASGQPISPEVEAMIRRSEEALEFPRDYDSPRKVSVPTIAPR